MTTSDGFQCSTNKTDQLVSRCPSDWGLPGYNTDYQTVAYRWYRVWKMLCFMHIKEFEKEYTRCSRYRALFCAAPKPILHTFPLAVKLIVVVHNPPYTLFSFVHSVFN